MRVSLLGYGGNRCLERISERRRVTVAGPPQCLTEVELVDTKAGGAHEFASVFFFLSVVASQSGQASFFSERSARAHTRTSECAVLLFHHHHLKANQTRTPRST